MATPFNGFEVIFTQKYGESDKQIKVEQFFVNEKDFYEKRDEMFIEVTEYLGLTLIFRSSSSDARFFMDALDTIPEQRLVRDPKEGEVFLPPSEVPVTLFENTQTYAALIPGLYRMMVVFEDQRFYSWVKVLPKNVEETQWEMMKQEIEQELNGLARDLLLKKTGLDTKMEGISQSLLEQFFVINKRFSSVMAALNDLYRKVNFQIKKEYELVPREKARVIDEKTIRHSTFRSNCENSFKTPVSGTTYGLAENRLVKKIIESIFKTLTGFIDSVEKHMISLMDFNSVSPAVAETALTVKELDKLSELAGKMRGAIQWIKTAPWYESVGVYKASTIPHVMNSDPRYRALYQLYRELKTEQIQERIHKSYAYHWKRSDKLYEIWGYIQFIKLLSGKDLGYVPERGWIYNQNFNDSTLLVPDLPAGTEVVFSKGNYKIHLVYDALLPTQRRLTAKKIPIYTKGTHTRPDARLDVYQDEIFIGSVIIDFKYRRRNSIWDEGSFYNGRQTDVMKQLVSYADNLTSPYLFTLEGEDSGSLFTNRISPVQEVWAIYPNRYNQSRIIDYPEHKISLIELTPGQTHNHITQKLKESIDKLIKTWGHFSQIKA